MGIPSKVAENSFIAAEKLILVQFPDPQLFAATKVSAKLDSVTAAASVANDAPEGSAASGEAAGGDAGMSEGGGGGGGRASSAGQHPMGVVCTCVRTGWSLMSSLFCVGEEVKAAR